MSEDAGVYRLTDGDKTPGKHRELETFYVTFGYAHSDPPGLLMKKYLVVKAADELDAREKVITEIGRKWAFIYDETEFAGQVEKYNLELWKVLT